MGAQFMVPKNNYRSDIKGHLSQITITNIIVKKLKIWCGLPKCDTEIGSEQMLEEK